MVLWKGVDLERVKDGYLKALFFAKFVESRLWVDLKKVLLHIEEDESEKQVVGVYYDLEFVSRSFDSEMLNVVRELAKGFGFEVSFWLVCFEGCKDGDGCGDDICVLIRVAERG